MRIAALSAILVVVILVAGSIGYTAPKGDVDYVPGEVLIITKESSLTDDAIKSSIIKSSPVKPIHIQKQGNIKDNLNRKRIFLLTFDKNADIIKISNALQKNPLVFIAQPDYVYTLQSTPNDPLYSEQWGLQRINAASAYDIETGSDSIVIAVIDSGLDLNHPEFQGKVLPGYDFVNCEQGCTPACAVGEDCTIEDDVPSDFSGHGTKVSGVAVANTNNSIGIASSCPNCKILPVRACYKAVDGTTRCKTTDVLYAIFFSLNDPEGIGLPQNNYIADVISMSFTSTINDPGIHFAITDAYNMGTVSVAAAGNEYTNIERYPAAWPEVIGVGATDENDAKALFSNYGSWVDVGAPGVSIKTTTIGDYGYDSGTSFSAPFVSGLAGLMLSQDPTLTQDQIREKLISTADPIQGNPFLGGRINAYKALLSISSDLKIQNFYQSAVYFPTNQTLYVDFQIVNDGPVRLDNVDLYIDKGSSDPDMSFTIPYIDAGETIYFVLHWTYSQNGQYNASISVDPYNDYPETNENNNLIAFNVVVQ